MDANENNNTNKIPNIMELDVFSLDQTIEYILAGNFSSKRMREEIATGTSSSDPIFENMVESFENGARPQATGYSDEQFFTIMSDFAKESDQKIILADGDTFVMEGNQQLLDELREKQGEILDCALQDFFNTALVIASFQKEMSEEMSVTNAPVERKNMETEGIVDGVSYDA